MKTIYYTEAVGTPDFLILIDGVEKKFTPADMKKHVSVQRELGNQVLYKKISLKSFAAKVMRYGVVPQRGQS